MAKKKVEATEYEVNEVKHRIYKEVQAKFGDGTIVSGNEIIERPRTIIPVSPRVNSIIGGGIPEGSWVVLAGKPKCGKDQPLWSKIQTPNGPKTMGEIQVGDEIFNAYGSTSKVVGVYPQGENDVYRINFTDGDSVESSKTHLWEVVHTRTGEAKVCQLQEIMHQLDSSDRPKWRVRLPEAVQYAEQSVSIDPYVMGLLLGDGSFRSKRLGYTTIDQQILDFIKKDLPVGYIIKRVKGSDIDYTIQHISNPRKNQYIHAIRNYGLWHKKSRDKYIPKEYIYNTINVRKSILQGLMDSDGYCSKRGVVIYYTASRQLSLDVKEIVNSLGGICVVKDKETMCNEKVCDSFACYIKFNDPSWLFRLERKRSRLKTLKRFKRTRSIASVEYLGKFPTQCIEVDSKDHLYLTDHYVVTHNTVTSLHFAKNCQKPEYGSRNVYYLNVEGRLKRRDILGINGINSDQLTIIESTEDRILSSQDYLQIAENILMTDKRCVLIIDSVSQLCEEREIQGGVGTETRGGGAKIMAQFTRQMGNVVPVKNSIVICILHLGANTSGMGSPVFEKGGHSIQYQVDVRLRALGDAKLLADSDGGNPYGQVVTWECKASALGPPGRKCESYIRYGEGIDEIAELLIDGKELGLINGSTWVSFDFLENHLSEIGLESWDEDKLTKLGLKVNGAEKARAALIANPQWQEILKKDIEIMLS